MKRGEVFFRQMPSNCSTKTPKTKMTGLVWKKKNINY